MLKKEGSQKEAEGTCIIKCKLHVVAFLVRATSCKRRGRGACFHPCFSCNNKNSICCVLSSLRKLPGWNYTTEFFCKNIPLRLVVAAAVISSSAKSSDSLSFNIVELTVWTRLVLYWLNGNNKCLDCKAVTFPWGRAPWKPTLLLWPTVAGWLRQWTAKPLCSARLGLNPTLVGISFGEKLCCRLYWVLEGFCFEA